MKEKLISLAISLSLIVTIGFKVVSYADTSVSGTVTSVALNIRSGPASTYSIIGQLSKGSTVKIVEKLGTWLKISYKNTEGYVSASYVSSIYSQTTTEGYISGCAFLNVRSGPGTGYVARGSIANGTKIQIVSIQDGWCKIIYNGNYAYVSATYVSNSANGNTGNNASNNNNSNSGNSNNSNGSTNNNGSSSGSQSSGSKKTGKVTAAYLNVRKEANTSSTVVGVLQKDNTVQIVDETGTWYKIIYKNDYAFVSKNYIILSGTQSSGTQTGGTQTVTNLNNFLFVGDSFTNRIRNIIEVRTTGSKVVAKGGAFPSEWIKNFSQMPDASNVKGVVLLIGINGISQEANLTDTKTLIDMLSKKYPGKTIYVQKVFPVGKGYAGYSDTQVANYNKNRIDTFNTKIKAYCSTKSNVKFIDATGGFVASNGFLINCESDGLHILDSYGSQFFSNIKTAVINAK